MTGYPIVILGWIHTNHNEFTRSLSEDQVIFLSSPPPSIPEKVSLVLYTRYVHRSLIRQLKKQKPIYRVCVEILDVKVILESQAEALVLSPKHKKHIHPRTKNPNAIV